VRERERERERVCVFVGVCVGACVCCVCVYVCVCVRVCTERVESVVLYDKASSAGPADFGQVCDCVREREYLCVCV